MTTPGLVPGHPSPGDGPCQFVDLLNHMAASVRAGDGERFADCFHPRAEYLDVFYGRFVGRSEIASMLTDYFHRDGEDFRWEFHEPLTNGTTAYAWYHFTFASKRPGLEGKRTMLVGAALFDLRDGLVSRYREFANSGATLAMLGAPGEVVDRHLRRTVEHCEELVTSAPARDGMT
jgi:ketosteroid isomerase-like protein